MACLTFYLITVVTFKRLRITTLDEEPVASAYLEKGWRTPIPISSYRPVQDLKMVIKPLQKRESSELPVFGLQGNNGQSRLTIKISRVY